jgi:hypothetical protein
MSFAVLAPCRCQGSGARHSAAKRQGSKPGPPRNRSSADVAGNPATAASKRGVIVRAIPRRTWPGPAVAGVGEDRPEVVVAAATAVRVATATVARVVVAVTGVRRRRRMLVLELHQAHAHTVP